MYIECEKASVKELYRLMIGSIIPRPIAWVSTLSTTGVPNLAPFSFFNCFGVDPPVLAFAPGYKSIKTENGILVREMKDTLRNVMDTNEFVVNLVSRSLAEQMNASAGNYPPEVSEFERVGLTTAASKLVLAPRVNESPISFECKLIQVFQHGNNNMVIGEVLGINVSDDVIDPHQHIDNASLQAIGRLAGNAYTNTIDGNFDLPRPDL